MYVNLSHSSIESIAEGLADVVKDYLEYADYENYKKLKEHEYAGHYTIEDMLEKISNNMAEEFHGDIESVINDYFDRNGFWQQDAEEAVDKVLAEADEEEELNKEDQ